MNADALSGVKRIQSALPKLGFKVSKCTVQCLVARVPRGIAQAGIAGVIRLRVLARADGDHVLRSGRRADGVVVDEAVGIGVHAGGPGREGDHHILVVPDELVGGGAVGGVGALRGLLQNRVPDTGGEFLQVVDGMFVAV